ncbi:hypothetical protein [Xanthomonas sp. SHU 199]|uniref:hypothetical protein n=1 Tax=Xanthomonas sp. SHU 199 TaxID=1591174 RepID=UPI00036B3B3F|nr:hypothetical protein [Xanthomonas sp. SHU 199]
MSWPYWLVGAVVVLLLCLAFRRKRVADHIIHCHSGEEMQTTVLFMHQQGYDCFVTIDEVCWQVRCYRRKGRQE